jgi:PGF-CTERM protein
MNNRMNMLVPLLLAIALVAPVALVAPMCGVDAASDAKVDVVVAGVQGAAHQPMQPTINAIKEVLSKYGNRISVTWIDMDSAQGKAYYSAHGLSAHMNILINGKYTYRVNGKDVTFQWFEGQQWTKADLDAVISSLLGSGSSATQATPSQTKAATPSASSKTQTTHSSSPKTANVTSNQTNSVQALPNNASAQTSSTPGFEAIFAVIGVVVVALIVKRFR